MTMAKYTTSFQKAQQATTGFVQSYRDAVETTLGASAKVLGPVDAAGTVDHLFDFLDTGLRLQRETTKQLVNIGVSFGDTVRGQAEEYGVAIREQAEEAMVALRSQAAAAQQAAHEKIVHTYEELTKPELQDELAKRDLGKTGSVDELRERLVADEK